MEWKRICDHVESKGVKAAWFVCGWQVKLCGTLVTRGPYLSALEIRSCNKALYKFAFSTFLL